MVPGVRRQLGELNMGGARGERVSFGTSGLRGPASILMDGDAFAHAVAFLRMLLAEGQILRGAQVLTGRDLRPSSPRILATCASAIAAEGFCPVNCGVLPTPALALAASSRDTPAIMVTGSH